MQIRPGLIQIILTADAVLLTLFNVAPFLLGPFPGPLAYGQSSVTPGPIMILNGLFPIWLGLASLLSATLPSWRLLARTLLIADALALIWIGSIPLQFGRFSPGLYVFGVFAVVLALASAICAVLLWAPAPAS